MTKNEKTIGLGLNVPLFCAGSLLTIFVGAPIIGLTGVWGFLVYKKPVPNYLKVLHSHLAWWSLAILIISIIIPNVPIKKWVKKIIVNFAFLISPLYAISMIAHYFSNPVIFKAGSLGTFYVTLFGFLAFLVEMSLFIGMILISLMAGGISIPFLTDKENKPSKFEIKQSLSIPRKTFLFFAVFLFITIIVGLFMLGIFVLQHKAIRPAVLVQFHTHIGLFTISVVMTTMVMSMIGVKESVINFVYKLGIIALTTTVFGFLAFIIFKLHSAIWVIPAMLYYTILFIGWLSLFGVFGIRNLSGGQLYIKNSLIVIWGALLIYVIAGPYLAVRYDTKPELTVTYFQKDGGIGGKHIGPYPTKEDWQGTAPNAGNPRGIENFHLSPASWSHTAILWLTVLFLFGEQMLATISIPNCIFFLATTIPIAPLLNSMGRIGAWGIPYVGAGALYMGGHPLKVINILTLIIISLLWMQKRRALHS